MTIISRDTLVQATACAASPSQRNVTRHGKPQRVERRAASSHSRHGHSIDGMEDPMLDLITSAPDPISAEERPWVYEQVLALVQQGRVWTDNRRRRWLHDGGPAPADRMPDRQQEVLAELYRQGHVRVSDDRVDMPAPDCRTLRVRRYETTTSGTELHHRWAGLSAYPA